MWGAGLLVHLTVRGPHLCTLWMALAWEVEGIVEETIFDTVDSPLPLDLQIFSSFIFLTLLLPVSPLISLAIFPLFSSLAPLPPAARLI